MDQLLDLGTIQARCDAATDGEWWIEETDQVWTLHGVHARIPSSVPEIGEQILNRQILKAPKTGTPYAEYWPNRADAAFIVAARTDVPALLARVRELEARLDERTADIADQALENAQLRAENQRIRTAWRSAKARARSTREHLDIAEHGRDCAAETVEQLQAAINAVMALDPGETDDQQCARYEQLDPEDYHRAVGHDDAIGKVTRTISDALRAQPAPSGPQAAV